MFDDAEEGPVGGKDSPPPSATPVVKRFSWADAVKKPALAPVAKVEVEQGPAFVVKTQAQKQQEDQVSEASMHVYPTRRRDRPPWPRSRWNRGRRLWSRHGRRRSRRTR
jgi:hypothetical protein